MAENLNEALATIKTREDALETIACLYGTFETEIGKRFLLETLEENKSKILSWLPDDVLIDLAKKHMYKEWK